MEKRVEFKGVDSGISAMISRLKQESKELGSDLIQDAQSYSSKVSDQVKFINDEIKAIQRRNQEEAKTNQLIAERLKESKLKTATTEKEKEKVESEYSTNVRKIEDDHKLQQMQVDLLKELVQTAKLEARQRIAEDRDSAEKEVEDFKRKPEEYESEDKLRLKFQEDMMRDRHDKSKGMGSTLFNSLLLNNLLGQISRTAQQLPQAQSELDLITPGTQIGGTLVGGALGSVADATIGTKIFGVGVGDTNLGVVGGQIGSQIGSMIGSSITRSMRSRYELQESQFETRGIAGRIIRTSEGQFSNLGMDRIQSAQLVNEIVKSSRTSIGTDGRETASEQARQAAVLEKSFSLDRGLVMDQFRQTRITGKDPTEILESISKSFEDLVRNGIMSKEDKIFFADFLRNSNQLVTSFSNRSDTMTAERANEIQMMFNQVGGAFKLGDPRSLPNIMAINQDLSQPRNDFIRASNFAALRDINPDANLFDLLKMQSKGLETPDFFNKVMGQIVSIYGKDDRGFGKVDLSKRFPKIDNLDTIERLYKTFYEARSRGEEGISTESFQKIISEDKLDTDFTFTAQDASRQASMNVTELERSQASITNAYIRSFSDGMGEVKNQFVDVMGKASEEVAKVFKEKMVEGLQFSGMSKEAAEKLVYNQDKQDKKEISTEDYMADLHSRYPHAPDQFFEIQKEFLLKERQAQEKAAMPQNGMKNSTSSYSYWQ